MTMTDEQSNGAEVEDFNEKIDSVFMAEGRHYEEGLKEGQTLAKHNSYVGGYEVGITKGKEVAQEIGFYGGFLEVLMRLSADDLQSLTGAKITEKKLQMISTLHHTISELCINTDTMVLNEEFFTEQLEKIRNKFKQIMSQLKLNVSYNSGEEESM